MEDCRALAKGRGHGLDRLRYVPLDRAGGRWISFGAEHRVRVEAFDEPDFGVGGAPDYTSAAQRALLHADLRGPERLRLFVQLSAVDEQGREPGPRPFDVSGVDAAQAFVDLPLGPLSVRLGRQETTLGGNRLVGLRDGATLRRAFDGVKADAPLVGGVLTGFSFRPVRNAGGAFDDEADSSDAFAGLTWDRREANGAEYGVFYFDRRRDRATYAAAVGKDRRHTFGLRYARRAGAWDAYGQGAIQLGELADRDVRAWGVTAEVGRTLDAPARPRLGVAGGLASGDDDRSDDQVATFDPLYPNLGVFSSAPLYYPANQVNLGVNVSARVNRATLTAGAVVLARYAAADAIYSNPGRPLAEPPGDDRLSAVLLEITGAVPLTARVELNGSVVRAEALDAVTAAGGRDALFGVLQLTTRF